MAQIPDDRARPIDIGMARPPRSAPPVDGTADRLAGSCLEFCEQFLDDLGDHLARCCFGLLRHHRAQRDQVRHEMNVGLAGRQEFRLEQHLFQAEPLEGVLLDHLHDGRRKELADIAEPTGDPWRRGAVPDTSARLLALPLAVIEARQRCIETLISLGKAGRIVAAERQPPATDTFGFGIRGRCVGHRGVSRS